jgi:hypothetical protein
MTHALTQADIAVVNAEAKACEVKDVLTVLRMALGFETAGLDADERSGIETVAGIAARLTVESMEEISKIRLLLKNLGPT